MLKFLAIFGSVALLVGVFSAVYVFACSDDWCAVFDWQKVKVTSTFEECVSMGFPVMESYPRQCRAGDKTFTEDISGTEDPFQKQFEPDGEEYEIPVSNSGIKGKVMIGPTCPVVQVGHEEECQDKPYKTSLRVYDSAKNLVKVILSDNNGRFEVGLPPGSYILDSDGEEVMPYVEPRIVLVEKDKYTDVVFTFDSGIR